MAITTLDATLKYLDPTADDVGGWGTVDMGGYTRTIPMAPGTLGPVLDPAYHSQIGAYVEDVYQYLAWAQAAETNYQNKKRVTLRTSDVLMEAFSSSGVLAQKCPVGCWEYVYPWTTGSDVLKNTLKSVWLAAVGKGQGTPDPALLSDELWGELAAAADGPITIEISKDWTGWCNWCKYRGGSAGLGAYEAAWEVIYYGANRAAPPPDYAQQNPDLDQILTNFGLYGLHQFLLGQAATKFLALLHANAQNVPETQFWIERLAPLTKSNVSQNDLETANGLLQYSNNFFRQATGLDLLRASAEAGGRAAATQEQGRQEGAAAASTRNLLWVLGLGAAGIGLAYWLKRRKKQNGGAK